MKIIMFWSSIIKNAKECGALRQQKKFKEADKLQNDMEEVIRLCDQVILDVPNKRYL